MAPEPEEEPQVQHLVSHDFCVALQRRGSKPVAHSASEFNHRGFAKQDGADAIQVLNHRRIVIENLRCIRFRAPSAWDPFYGEEIFCRIGDSVQRAAIVPALDFLFRGLGLAMAIPE